MTLRWRRASLVIILLLSLVFSGPFIIWNEKLEIPNTALNVTGYICGANVLKIDDNSNSFLGFIFFVFLIK
jgi:ABC-type thiamin/hydroxymethylpyrimidine transport system permease subunit